MKVLHVIPGIAPRYGGPSTAVIQACRALMEKGVETLTVTTDADGSNRLPVVLEIPVRYQGIDVIFFHKEISERFKYSRRLSKWLFSHVCEFDLVHIDAVFSHSSLTASKACLKFGIPYIIRPLGSLARWSLKRKRYQKKILWYSGVKRMLENAVAIHYTTLQEQEEAESGLGLRNGTVIPLGIDIAALDSVNDLSGLYEEYPSLKESPYVISLSRLHPKKGLDLFVEVFLKLTEEPHFRQWKFLISGDGDAKYVSFLQQLVKKLHGDKRVLFTGWLDGEKKISALKGASLMVLPSKHENFGLSVVEALGCGVPVLVSQHVNISKEIQQEGSGWVSELTKESLYANLKMILLSDKERELRGEKGKTLARSKYSWSAIASQLIDLYNDIITRKTRKA